MRSKDLLHSGGRGAIALALGATMLLSMAAPVAAANHVRPFFGYGSGPSTLGPPIADCPAGSMWYVTGHGTGNFTHLGRANFTFEQCAVANMETGWGWTVGKSSMTIVATKGDRLSLSYDMTFHATPISHPTTAEASLRWVVVGGTGRFVHAKGWGVTWMHIEYTPDLTGAQISGVWWGTLAY